MEIEYKFYLPSIINSEMIRQDPFWDDFTHEPWRLIDMEAIYYEVPDLRLSEAGIALRVRQENELTILTIKAPAGLEGTLSERLEWNFPLRKKAISLREVIELLRSEQGTQDLVSFLEDLGDQELFSDMHTAVTRYESRMNLGESYAVLSIDEGYLAGGTLEEPCRELEVEYLSGDEKAFRETSLGIQKHFGLLGDTENKLVRMLRLRKRSRKQM